METKDLDFFRSEVREFDEIDSQIKAIKDKIKPLNAKVRELTKKKTELQSGICDFMSRNEIDACNLNSGKLEYKETKSTKPLTMGDIRDKIKVFFETRFNETFKSSSAEEKAETFYNFIYKEEREVTPKTVLRRKN